MVEYFKEAVGVTGKVHAANSEHTYALQMADHYILTPSIYNSSYISTLLDYCREHQITALISLFDIDLPVLSKNRKLFEAIGVKLVISDFELVDICNDKWKTYQLLSNNNFDTPRTFISLESAKKALLNKEIRLPLIVKPRWGMGSIGIFEADNEVELEVFYYKTKKTILNSYLKFESESAINESVVIQEKVNGREFGLDIFNDLNGNFLTCVPKQKIAMRAGETDIARVFNDESLTSLGKNISRITKHVGNLDVDFFITNDDQPYILELNCRFGGQYPFSHLAGVNFPRAIIQLLKSEKPENVDLNFMKITGYKDFNIRRCDFE